MRPKFLKSIFIRAGNNPWHERRRIKFETNLKVNKPILIFKGRGHRKSFLAFLNPDFGYKIHFCKLLSLIVLNNQGLEFSSSIWLYVWMNVSRLQNRTSLLRLLLGDVEKKRASTEWWWHISWCHGQPSKSSAVTQRWIIAKNSYETIVLHQTTSFKQKVLVCSVDNDNSFFNLHTFKNCLHLVFESDRFGRLYLGFKNFKIAK